MCIHAGSDEGIGCVIILKCHQAGLKVGKFKTQKVNIEVKGAKNQPGYSNEDRVVRAHGQIRGRELRVGEETVTFRDKRADASYQGQEHLRVRWTWIVHMQQMKLEPLIHITCKN